MRSDCPHLYTDFLSVAWQSLPPEHRATLACYGEVAGAGGDRRADSCCVPGGAVYSKSVYLAAPPHISLSFGPMVGLWTLAESSSPGPSEKKLSLQSCRASGSIGVRPLPVGQSVETGVVLGYRLRRYACN